MRNEVLQSTGRELNLANVKLVESLLRNFANTCIHRRSDMLDKRLESARMDVADASALAEILLGRHPQYTPVAGWNCPGIIDAWLVAQLGVRGRDANERVTRALVTYLLWAYQTMVDMESMDADFHQFMVDGLVQKFTWLMCGVEEIAD